MAISFPLTHPSSPGFKSVTFRMVTKSAMNSSPFTGHQQITAFPGQWWEVDIELPLMARAQAADWQAFLASLNGNEGYFSLGDPDGSIPRGVATGTPLVNGSGQTGQDLNIKGWTPSTVGIMKAGDYIQVENNLYMVLQDVDSDVGGDATVSLFPKIRVAHPDSSSVVVNNTQGHFRLVDPTRGWNSDMNNHYSISMTVMEKI